MAKKPGKITVTVTTVAGKNKQPHEVEMDATSVQISAVLKKAGLSADGMNITVGGRPVSTSDYVENGADVSLTEKVRGS